MLNTVLIAERMFQNTRIKNTLSDIAAELRGGKKLSTALGKSEYVHKTVIQILNTGEDAQKKILSKIHILPSIEGLPHFF